MTFIKMDKSTIAFILLFIISLINPQIIYDLDKSFIGKIIILIVIVFFSSTNILLGLLTIFIYFSILEKYKYVLEGMTNDENKKDKKNKKDKIIISTSNPNGVDIQDIRDSIASVDSNSLPLSKDMFKSSDNVEPFNTM
jgi:hypothetical protein